MSPSNADSLRSLLRHIAWTLAASSLVACSSTVTHGPEDAGADVASDTPTTDIPSTHDVPSTDVPSEDTPRTDGPPADVDPCAGRPTSTMNPCLGQDLAFACGLPAGVSPVDGGEFSMADCTRLCATAMGFPVYTCALLPPEGGVGATVRCNYACGVGRRADGFHWDDGACDGLGAWFAHVAALEGAAVVAFDRMADELRAWGAPDDLVADALAARAEEVDHAARTAGLAARFGATPVSFTVDAPAARSLEAMAVENAVEGCVRETYGALVAWWQSRRARDADVLAALRGIADDETRHAALSWRVHAWMRTRLDHAALARVEGARRDAVRALRDELRAPMPAAVMIRAGLPSSDEAAALLDALEPALA